MYWILAAVVLTLTIAVPKFRRAGIIAGSVLALLLLWAIQRSNPWIRTPEASKQLDAAKQLAPQKSAAPPPDIVQPQNVKLSGTGAPWNFTGRLLNTSTQYQIRSVTFEITRRDCYPAAPDPSGCVLLWQSTETIFLVVPPNEWREFSSAMWLHSSLPRARGELTDTFNVIALDAIPYEKPAAP